MKLMLCKNVLKRIHKLVQVKNHIFFSNFNWDSLLSFNLETCYTVNLEGAIPTESVAYATYMQVKK